MSEVIPDEALAGENKRLRMLIGELLDATGLNDAERTEWLDRNRLSESAVYPDDDEDDEDDGPYYVEADTTPPHPPLRGPDFPTLAETRRREVRRLAVAVTAATPGQTARDRWRKRPVVVDAVQWTGDNLDEVYELAGCVNFDVLGEQDRLNCDDPEATASVFDKLHSTWILVYTGQWVIKGIKGEFYPCADDVFRETYEPAEQEPPAAPGLAIDLDADVTEEQAAEICKALEAVNVTRAAVAPELAAAMRETRDVRDGYARLCEEFSDSPQSGQSARISLTVLNRHRKAAGLSARRPAPAGEHRDVFMQMREKLDAMADLTAGMHAEAQTIAPASSEPDSMPDMADQVRAQVLHEYAARIRQLLEA